MIEEDVMIIETGTRWRRWIMTNLKWNDFNETDDHTWKWHEIYGMKMAIFDGEIHIWNENLSIA